MVHSILYCTQYIILYNCMQYAMVSIPCTVHNIVHGMLYSVCYIVHVQYLVYSAQYQSVHCDTWLAAHSIICCAQFVLARIDVLYVVFDVVHITVYLTCYNVWYIAYDTVHCMQYAMVSISCTAHNIVHGMLYNASYIVHVQYLVYNA